MTIEEDINFQLKMSCTNKYGLIFSVIPLMSEDMDDKQFKAEFKVAKMKLFEMVNHWDNQIITKQKVKDAIRPEKVEEYLNLLHTQPSDSEFSSEYRRGWMASGSELTYTIRKELNLE